MSAELDRVKAGLLKVILSVLNRTDYHALYGAIVVVQNADGTVDVRPESKKLREVQRVPIRLGIPGAKVTISAGARVLLGFEGGEPSRPVVMLWDTGELVTLSINAGTTGLAKADHTHGPGTFNVTGTPVTGASGTPSSNTTLIKVP